MNLSKNQLIKIPYWKILAISLGSQVAANLFFGIPLMTMIFIDYPSVEIRKVIFLYSALYTFFYIPIYFLLPHILLPRINRFFKKYYLKEEIKLKEVIKVIRGILNFPLNIAFWVFITCFLGFAIGLIIAKWGGFLEIVIGKTEIITTLSIGFMVGLIQCWLNYVLFERFFQPVTQFLISLYPQLSPIDLKIRKLPLFFKYLFMGTLGTMVSQLSLFLFYYREVAIYLPPSGARRFLIFNIIIMILVFCFVFFISLLSARSIKALFKRFIEWSKKIATGDLNQIVDIRTTDEISDVAFFLDQMRQKLKRAYGELEEAKITLGIRVEARTKELKELTLSLDKQVKERTKELQEKINELERFRELAVGRELKMIELKKEIERLEELLKSKSK